MGKGKGKHETSKIRYDDMDSDSESSSSSDESSNTSDDDDKHSRRRRKQSAVAPPPPTPLPPVTPKPLTSTAVVTRKPPAPSATKVSSSAQEPTTTTTTPPAVTEDLIAKAKRHAQEKATVAKDDDDQDFAAFYEAAEKKQQKETPPPAAAPSHPIKPAASTPHTAVKRPPASMQKAATVAVVERQEKPKAPVAAAPVVKKPSASDVFDFEGGEEEEGKQQPPPPPQQHQEEEEVPSAKKKAAAAAVHIVEAAKPVAEADVATTTENVVVAAAAPAAAAATSKVTRHKDSNKEFLKSHTIISAPKLAFETLDVGVTYLKQASSVPKGGTLAGGAAAVVVESGENPLDEDGSVAPSPATLTAAQKAEKLQEMREYIGWTYTVPERKDFPANICIYICQGDAQNPSQLTVEQTNGYYALFEQHISFNQMLNLYAIYQLVIAKIDAKQMPEDLPLLYDSMYLRTKVRRRAGYIDKVPAIRAGFEAGLAADPTETLAMLIAKIHKKGFEEAAAEQSGGGGGGGGGSRRKRTLPVAAAASEGALPEESPNGLKEDTQAITEKNEAAAVAAVTPPIKKRSRPAPAPAPAPAAPEEEEEEEEGGGSVIPAVESAVGASVAAVATTTNGIKPSRKRAAPAPAASKSEMMMTETPPAENTFSRDGAHQARITFLVGLEHYRQQWASTIEKLQSGLGDGGGGGDDAWLRHFVPSQKKNVASALAIVFAELRQLLNESMVETMCHVSPDWSGPLTVIHVPGSTETDKNMLWFAFQASRAGENVGMGPAAFTSRVGHYQPVRELVVDWHQSALDQFILKCTKWATTDPHKWNEAEAREIRQRLFWRVSMTGREMMQHASVVLKAFSDEDHIMGLMVMAYAHLFRCSEVKHRMSLDNNFKQDFAHLKKQLDAERAAALSHAKKARTEAAATTVT